VTVLKRDRNVWRLETARRVAVFRDVATCFAAIRSSLLKARSSVTIVGWDIDSRCRLVGPDGSADDGFPAELGPLLGALGRRNPGLRINLLLWNFSSIYALEREAFPRAKLNWSNVNLWLDDCLPPGSSQHQKLVIVDDCIAFAGGLDLTIRRWDTAAHLPTDPCRIDPGGAPYDPFHDVHAVIDGDAASALAELARQRWLDAAGTALPPAPPSDAWPTGVVPDFEDVRVGIARTLPKQDGEREVREVETLFCDMIAAAETTLYIENQFLSSSVIAEAIARRLRQNPRLRILIVAPQSLHSWLEILALTHGRARFRKLVEQSGAMDRIRLTYPSVSDGRTCKAVLVHSKVMIVDDRIARIGSANLNNRSMGADSECDVVIEAETADERERIADLRNSLIAMHCGVTRNDVAEAIARSSIIEASRELSGGGHALRDLHDPEPNEAEYTRYLDRVADPERPIDEGIFLSLFGGDDRSENRAKMAWRLAIAALILIGMATGWSAVTDDVRGLLSTTFQDIAASRIAAPTVLIVYVVGGFMLIPITLLIVATSAAFGLAWGLAYAALGTMASALAGYCLGAWLGKKAVRRIMGGKLLRVRDAIRRRGILSIAAIRMVPVAPFTIVNLAAGALGVGLGRFLAGTVIGMAPGFVVFSALGHHLYRLVSAPTLATLAAAIGLVLLWCATALAIQHMAKDASSGPA
jgi:phospholipase D1/2